jgi:hypothetical protein
MPRKHKSLAEAAEASELKKKAPGRKYVPHFTTDAEAVADVAAEIEEGTTPAPKKPSKTRASLQKFSTDGDLVDVWERRLLNPDSHQSTPIRIKTPGMRIRWINLANRGRFQRARYEQGWIPVHQSELMDEREIFGVSFTSEGHVCRGEKQAEMLMKMPQAVYAQIQKRRADLNTQSYKKLRDNLSAAGQSHFKDKYSGDAGDIAADAASKFVGSVKFGTERASTDDLLGD